ncbi:MAG: zinc dependent phospholipase C family protein [Deltaproteobacteria bacterium]|nr:zinc dependent phospholipase C family protein [Deltaproteobacteria bacterium]
MFYFLFVFFVYFFSSTLAQAWGPGAHLEYALNALSHLTVLAPAVKLLLKKYPKDFLYGNLAADIIFGKKFAGELYHCHHWDVALPLLDRAKTDSQKAFIYGYLTHLSVDTVAHNYFVPYQIIRSYEALTLRHTYWEMRYDLKMPERVWSVLEEIGKEDYSKNDELLSNTLRRALFSFKTTKKIFDNILLLQRTRRWRNAAQILTNLSTYSLHMEDVEDFKGLCYKVSVDFLKHPDKAFAFQADPTGKLKLLYAKEMVSKFRRARHRKEMNSKQADLLIEDIRIALRDGIYKPAELPDIL